MNLHISTTPPHLRITQTMIEDLIIDPVAAVRVFFDVELDDFQKDRMRTYWFMQNVIDSSGVNTMKTEMTFFFLNLRCLLLGNSWAAVFYQSFGSGKQFFWPLYRKWGTDLFKAQLGKTDQQGESEGKANLRDAACYTQHFKNESLLRMPAPSWSTDAKNQASGRYNTIGLDEWTESATMGGNAQGSGWGGIDEQIMTRLNRPCFCNEHPIHGNHLLMTGHAQNMQHPGYQRWRDIQSAAEAGDPNYAVITYNYKDFSNKKTRNGQTFRKLYRNDGDVDRNRKTFPSWKFLETYLGFWSTAGKGWYRAEALLRCAELGREQGVEVMIGKSAEGGAAGGPVLRSSCGSSSVIPSATAEGGQVGRWAGGQEAGFGSCLPSHLPTCLPWYYFLGVDPGPVEKETAADAAMVGLRARLKADYFRRAQISGDGFYSLAYSSQPSDWQCEYVYAYRFSGGSKATADQAAGKIHQLNIRFGFSLIMLDAQGGGYYWARAMNKAQQVIDGIPMECIPIASPSDTTVPMAAFILRYFQRRECEALWPNLPGDDNLVDAMHVAFQEALEQANVLFPESWKARERGPRAELEKQWSQEQVWAAILLDIIVEQITAITVLTTTEGRWLTQRHGARVFKARGKKDLAYAAIYAYIAFLLWLKSGASDTLTRGGESSCHFIEEGMVESEGGVLA